MTDSDVSPELRRATLSGARWTASSRLAAELVAFSSSVILARLVPPSEFGYAAVALIVIALSAVLGAGGVTATVVQRSNLSPSAVASVWALGFVLGCCMTLLSIGLSVTVVGSVFGERTAQLTLLASPAWLLVGIGSTSVALLQRALRFRALAAIEATSVIVSAASAVALALGGADGEAIVAGGLILVALTAIVSFAVSPPRGWPPTLAEVRKSIAFAAPVTASSLVWVGYRNVDYAILGARTTASQLGYYWRAFQLGVGYQSKISRVMLRVSLPVYSRAVGMDELRAVRTRIVRGHASTLLPLLAVFIAAAPVLVPWLFGPAWEPSVRPAQILAVAGMADAVVTGVGPLMIALGRPGVLLRYNLVVFGAYALMVFVLAPHGIEAVAIGVALFGIANVLSSQLVLLRPTAGLSFRQLWMDTRAGVVVGAIMLLVGTTARESLKQAGLGDVGIVVGVCLVSSVVYVLVLRRFFILEWSDIRAVVTKARREPESTSSAGEAVT